MVKISIYLRCFWKHLYSCWTNLTLSSELLMLFCFPILADEIQMFVAWFHCFVGEISMAVWSNQHLLLVKCFNANPTQTLGSSWPALVGLARAAPVLAAWCFSWFSFIHLYNYIDISIISIIAPSYRYSYNIYIYILLYTYIYIYNSMI